MECLLVLGTFALVFVTAYFMREQIREQARIGDGQLRIAADQLGAFRNDLGVRLLLVFSDRFDSPRLVKHRQVLAHQLQTNVADPEIKEAVMNFFEDLGLVFRRGYLNEHLIWSTFGFYAVGWWGNCAPYITRERGRKTDQSIFEDFEKLAARMSEIDKGKGINPPDLAAFLTDELQAS
jgi:hypothetical protein